MQGELERALARICDAPVRVMGAGRTDAGVHATGQAIHFRSATGLDEASLGRGVNALLPPDIAVSALGAAAEDFHARFSATGRTYEYRIRSAPHRDPLERHREFWLPDPLEDEALKLGAETLVGRHDFTAFATGEGGLREVRRAAWRREGELLRFEIAADGFLRGMVRAIVGTMIWIGRGRLRPADAARILESRDRRQAGPSAPAQGLCLIGVDYGVRERRRDEDDDDTSE
ncbi:tRNA pseudouridine(38-40) synthase TruA [soil metagenome]